MLGNRKHRFPTGLALAAPLIFACGGNDDDDRSPGGQSAASTGTVSGTPWEAFCTATFTTDYDVLDFGEVVLTAKAGETYLLVDFGSASSGARLVFLAADGPADFSVAPDPATGAFPFESNCAPETAVDYYAAFTDVIVYADAELSTELCTIESGTALPAGGGLRGYALAENSGFTGPETYEVQLDAFSPQCGNAEYGYVSVPETEALGATTWLVPIISILAPE